MRKGRRGPVGEREIVVPGGDAAPLLEEVEGLLDCGPRLVGPGVEVHRATAAGAPTFAVGDLVPGFGDHGPDLPGRRQFPVGLRGVGLVPEHRIGPGPGPAAAGAGTRTALMTCANIRESKPWPGSMRNASGQPFPS